MQVKSLHFGQSVEYGGSFLLGSFAVQSEHDLDIIVAVLDQR